MFRKFLALSITAASLAGLSACSAPERMSVSGSTTVLPAVSRAAEQFTADTGQLITVNAGGSGSGFNQLAEGQTDIGMMSRDITEGERAQFPNFTFMPIAIGRDAVVPVVSSEIYDAGVTQLSLSDIAKIYRGESDNWAEFGGPDKAIFVIDKESSSGTRQTFMDIVMGSSKADAPGADLVIGSNNEEQTAISQSDSAIGMLSFAWINDDVRAVAIDTPRGNVAATIDNVNSGAFPITRDLVMIIRQDVSPATSQFVNFMLSPEGQKHVAASGYLPVNQ